MTFWNARVGKIKAYCTYFFFAETTFWSTWRSATFAEAYLTLSWQRSLSYRNQSYDLLCKSMDWFLYDRHFRRERVKILEHLHDGTFLQK